jgi:hypothetical protein
MNLQTKDHGHLYKQISLNISAVANFAAYHVAQLQALRQEVFMFTKKSKKRLLLKLSLASFLKLSG